MRKRYRLRPPSIENFFCGKAANQRSSGNARVARHHIKVLDLWQNTKAGHAINENRAIADVGISEDDVVRQTIWDFLQTAFSARSLLSHEVTGLNGCTTVSAVSGCHRTA